nr:hypothetical protein CcurKRNrm1_p096 [Cryptomonas curvata]
MLMIFKKVNFLLNFITTIKKEMWYFMSINFEINTIRIFKIELKNIFTFFCLCCLSLVNIKKYQSYKNENRLLIFFARLLSEYKRNKILILIRNFHKNLYLKCFIKIKIENIIIAKKKKQIQKFLKKLIKVKNIYKKSIGLKIMFINLKK